MPAAYKTPGVYIVEKDAFPNSVVEVATAVPAFVGYTEKADSAGKSLFNIPTRITSLSDFETYFGGAPTPKFTFAEAQAGDEFVFTVKDPSVVGGAAGKTYALTQTDGQYFLYYSMKLFFQNGGGPCYIVSVGAYQSGEPMDSQKLMDGIDKLEAFPEPTMVVIPDAVLLEQAPCYSLQEHMLMHCGLKMMNRVAILDLYNGDQKISPNLDPVADFRNNVVGYLSYGAAYYPWLDTTIVQDRELDYHCMEDADALVAALRPEMAMTPANANDTRAQAWNDSIDALLEQIKTPPAAPANIADKAVQDAARDQANQSLQRTSPGFKALLGAAARKLSRLPPSAAMAGVYKAVDDTRGVWKAPANVGVLSTVGPTVQITNAAQEDLNVTPMGKSINAIRSFIGEGTLVWGARTLDGNSLDWRYINVRRTMIMLEESCKLAAKAYVFEPNVAGTWVSIKSMIENFLTSVWRRGGLAGATPQDAFSVHVGLGDTMTADDILEGYLRVTVLVAISHPAEFIEITFQQQMQKS